MPFPHNQKLLLIMAIRYDYFLNMILGFFLKYACDIYRHTCRAEGTCQHEFGSSDRKCKKVFDQNLRDII